MSIMTALVILFVTNTIVTIISCITFYCMMTSKLNFSPIKNKLESNYNFRVTLALLLSVAIYFAVIIGAFLILINNI